MSVGWKLVSLRLSKPTPNSISGTVHDPKSAEPTVVSVVAGAAAALVVAAAVVVASPTETVTASVGVAVTVPVTVTVTAVYDVQTGD